MGDNASLPYFLQSYLLYQMSDRMESSTSLESTDTLIVLAFEEQIETRSRLSVPRCRSYLVDGFICQQGSAMHMVVDLTIRLGYRAGLEGHGSRNFRHG
jgi:hypothetical protein